MHVIDVFRARLKVPQLRAKAIELARMHRAKVLLIEDASSGTALIQLLDAEQPAGVPSPIPRRPHGDKNARAMNAAAIIETRPFLRQFRLP